MRLRINGETINVDADPQMPLLWAIRDVLGMTGTKFGCGVGACGACTVHLDGDAVRSCITPWLTSTGKDVTTIEGLSRDGTHPVQLAWIAQQRSAVRLLSARPDHAGRRSAQAESQTNRRANHRRHVRKYLPVRHVSTHPHGDQVGSGGDLIMTDREFQQTGSCSRLRPASPGWCWAFMSDCGRFLSPLRRRRRRLRRTSTSASMRTAM